MKAPRDWRALVTGGTIVVVVLGGGLFIQHLRHGWPFSLHHGFAANAPALPAAAAHSAGAVEPAHARVPIELDASKLAAIGARIERARRETISKPLRTVATIVPDESRISHVHTRVSGWIEQLHINTTGQVVRAGQPLAGIFSQELLSSQSEYLAAKRGAGQGPASVVLQGARSRLKVLGMTDDEIRGIEATGEPRRLVTVLAPRKGVVIHRGVSVGTAVDPSTELVTIADLSSVWLIAEIPENDIPSVQLGTPAIIEVSASGRPPIESSVAFLYPTLSERTRTLRARFVLENRDGALRPGLYANVDFKVTPREALTVPRDAVVDTGESQHVFVVEHEGHFVPRTVKLAARLGDRIEVIEGLSDGESIVASGVFLIDSESRLRASGGGTGHAHGSHAAPAEPAPFTKRAAPAKRATPAKPATAGEPAAPSDQHEGHQGHEGH